jgi:ligand-binding SRPBCC domain-containing protein
VRGPYKQWIHTHKVTEGNGFTRIADKVHYRLPLFPLGELAYPLGHLELRRIFAYRQKTIWEIFTKSTVEHEKMLETFRLEGGFRRAFKGRALFR